MNREREREREQKEQLGSSSGRKDRETKTDNSIQSIKEQEAFILEEDELSLEEWEGELDLAKFEEGSKIRRIRLPKKVKNFSVVNYSLPLTLWRYNNKKDIDKRFNIPWLFDNEKVVIEWTSQEELQEFAKKRNCDKVAQKIIWRIISENSKRPAWSLWVNLYMLIDTSDLDQIIEDYDYSRWGDKEYHQQLFGGKGEFDDLCTAFDNLANRIIARTIIVANRLTHGEDKDSEENIMKLAYDFQRCYEIPKPKVLSEMEEEEAREKLEVVINQALSGDKELLKRLVGLPYLSEWVKEQLKN